MAVYIHREKRFNKLLDTLRKGSKEAALASVRADDLIGNIAVNGVSDPELSEKRTKHGELRIDKCYKYDLGSGYRLVCVRHGEHLIVTHVGSHDDCHRWIENNRRFDPDIELECTEVDPAAFDMETPDSYCTATGEEPDYDEILMKKVDDRILRRIFRGLCGG